MTPLPSGLATIAASFDDASQVRGAVDMAMRLRRADALSKLAEMDAPLIGVERPADVERAVASGGEGQIEAVARALWASRVRCAAAQGIDLERWGDGAIPRANGIMEDAAAAIAAIDRHAALAIGSAYRAQDRR